MNSDEIKNALSVLVATFGGVVMTKYNIDGNTLNSVIGAVVTLGGVGYSIASHWNQKKVPETAVVLPQKGS